MRTRPVVVITSIAVLGLAVAAHGQDAESVRVTLSPPAHLVAQSAAEVIAEIEVPPGGRPVLVTPTSEGTAVEVVRGRLLRADADEVRPNVLRFRIPIVVRAAGTAVLRVRVLAYACERRCRAVEGDSVVILRVDRAG